MKTQARSALPDRKFLVLLAVLANKPAQPLLFLPDPALSFATSAVEVSPFAPQPAISASKSKEKEKEGLLPMSGWATLKADCCGGASPATAHADKVGDLVGPVAAPTTAATFCWVDFPYLRQSLTAAGIIEESESARGEGGRVGQGRV